MIPSKIALIIPRLATEHVGELVATRDALVRALTGAGLDLHDLAAACQLIEAVGEGRTSPSRSAGLQFGDLARAARDLDCGRLSPRERGFVESMCSRGFAYRPSPRQAQWLDDILSRLQGRAAA